MKNKSKIFFVLFFSIYALFHWGQNRRKGKKAKKSVIRWPSLHRALQTVQCIRLCHLGTFFRKASVYVTLSQPLTTRKNEIWKQIFIVFILNFNDVLTLYYPSTIYCVVSLDCIVQYVHVLSCPLWWCTVCLNVVTFKLCPAAIVARLFQKIRSLYLSGSDLLNTD